MLVPKLRFKEFNNEWIKLKLKNISTELQYGMGAAAIDYDGKNKYIRITDIDDISSQYINNPVSPDGKLEDKYLVNENDILFARTGASVGKTYLYNIKDGKLYFAGFLIRAHIKDNYNALFVFEQTKLNSYKKWVKLTSARSGQPGINSIEYGNYEFSITTLEEQEKIANFLLLLDKKIELQQKKIDVLKMYKKGLINKLLTETIGTKKSLYEIIGEYTEKSSINNEYDVISSTTKGLFLQKEYFKKDISSEDNTGYKILKKYQIVLSPQNLWMGNINFNDKYEIGIVSPSYKIYDIKEGYNKNFINILMSTPKAIYEYSLASEQGASIVRRNLNVELFEQISFNIPEEEIQNKIDKYVSAISNKLEIAVQKYEELNILKKGLLQQMFI